MESCEHCELLEGVIDELSEELAYQQRRRRELYRTIRLLRGAVVQEMESEHSALSQADGYAGSEPRNPLALNEDALSD